VQASADEIEARVSQRALTKAEREIALAIVDEKRVWENIALARLAGDASKAKALYEMDAWSAQRKIEHLFGQRDWRYSAELADALGMSVAWWGAEHALDEATRARARLYDLHLALVRLLCLAAAERLRREQAGLPVVAYPDRPKIEEV
jgi:hypothetical protein